ncbi:MAG: T9SS type B sorting domain-containing protein, partial [bacterium]
VKDGAGGPFETDTFTDTLTNTSGLIQAVEYIITPVIEDASHGLLCSNGIKERKIVEVVPTLLDTATLSEFIGGWNIRCNGLENAEINLHPYGGYYRGENPYTFTWEKDGVPLNKDSVSLAGLGPGTYSYAIEDILGCSFDSTLLITQPERLRILDSLKHVSCAGTEDGAIYLQLEGGTSGYDLNYDGPNLFINDRFVHLSQTSVDSFINRPYGDYEITLTDTNSCLATKTVRIYDGVSVAIGLDPTYYGLYNISCTGLSDGAIEVTAGGSGDPDDFSYEWTDQFGNSVPLDSTGKGISGVPAGYYFIAVTDTTNCSSNREIELIEPTPLVISRIDGSYPGGYDISCYGYNDGDINISVSGSHSYSGNLNYLWSDSESGVFATSQDIAGVDTGIYKLIVTDEYDCIARDTFTLTQPTQIDYTVLDSSNYNGFDISCYTGQNGFIELDVSGSSGNYEYTWSTADGYVPNPNIRNLRNAAAGTYNLHIHDISYNCETNWQFTLIEPDTLDTDPVLSNYNNFNIRCYNDTSGSILLNTYGGVGPYTFDWNTTNGQGLLPSNEDQSGLTAGTYSVMITDNNNCVGEWSFGLDQPEELYTDINPTPIACYGFNTGAADLSVSGGVPGYSYSWSNGNITQDISEVPAGTYSVTVTDQNSCIIVDRVDITQEDKININMEVPEQYNGAMVSCYGEEDAEIYTSVNGGFGEYRYEWRPTGDNTADLIGVPAGVYVLKVTDELECSSLDSVEIVNPLRLTTNVYPINPTCYSYSDGRITVLPRGGTISGDYRINWQEFEESGQVLDSIGAGTYHVSISDLNNCTIDTVAILSEPDSLFIEKELGHPDCPDIMNGSIEMNVTGGTPPYDLFWTNGDNGSYLDNLREGVYVVNITDNRQCVLTDTTELISQKDYCIEIPTTFTPNGDGINDIWEIVNIDLYPEATMEIFNRWGELLYQISPYYGNEWDGTYNGRELPIDSYHFVLRLGGGRKPVTGNVTIIH